MQDVIGPIGQDPNRLRFDLLGGVEVDFPIPRMGEVGEYLAIHDGVGAGFIRRAKLNGYVIGEIRRPGSQRYRDDGFGQYGGNVVERGRCRAKNRGPHLGDERSHAGDVETVAVIVNRGRRHAGLYELDPSTVNNLVVG
jgi:hypothetical protein